MRTCAQGKRYCNGRLGVNMTSKCLYVLMATLDTKCQKLAKIGLKMYFMCFHSFSPGDQVTRTGEWEIWSVSGRLPDSLGELAQTYNTGRLTASFPSRGRQIHLQQNQLEWSRLFDNVVLFLLENNNFNTCIMLMIIFEN